MAAFVRPDFILRVVFVHAHPLQKLTDCGGLVQLNQIRAFILSCILRTDRVRWEFINL